MDNQWDKYAKLYNQGIGKEGDQLHTKLIDPIIFDFIGRYQSKTILDVGCGNGYLLKKLASQAKKVVGIDSSRKLLQYARGLISQNCQLILADLNKKFPLKPNSFDIVIANMVVQYLPTLNRFVVETARVLKKKGILVIILDHPAHALFLRAQGLVGARNKKFIDSDSYFKLGKRRKHSLWDKAILEYYHRPIKDYLNPFTPYFYLEKLEEKTSDGELPRILGMKWVKRRC